MSEVAFSLKKDMIKIDLEGSLPVYRNNQFEKGIRKWLKESLKKRENEFKAALQMSEREIMSSFAFKKEIH